MATKKELFAIALMEVAQNIASKAMDDIDGLTAQYFAQGYNGAWSDPIIDGDLTGFNDLSAADVTNVITAFQQLSNYFNNSAVTTVDYAVTFNTVRNVKFG